ncbi:UNVERIFIED_CONTAM: hypothetical protein GTU68_012856, partial [Idotea baltica]|nr:hypothetical protein [Idotea baltica]
MAKTAITPTREQDYPGWYQQVVRSADLAENSPVRGCMVIKPWGYGIWENMQAVLDRMFKDTGHENAYFPLFIPKSFLEKEAEHVDGFAKECAVGGLVPAGKLEEPLIVRPTSETIIGHMFAKWVESYRDLPLKINQWANVVRWEMRVRLFLRTAEFLWQEGHTAHETKEEALEETRLMLDVYADFAENYMAMPVIKGEKTIGERFPGADTTYSIESMMQDRKALQAGTSHFLGQNFSKAQEIKFQNKDGGESYAWTTSWGVSTRLIGALIMTHSDDDGLMLPPRLAPKHVVICPVIRKEEEREAVMEYCESLRAEIKATHDDRDVRGGEKKWYHVKRGVPIRIEAGPRDIESESVFVGRRDQPKSSGMKRAEFVANVAGILTEIQDGMFQRALTLREENTRTIKSFEKFKKYFTPKNQDKPEVHGGFAKCFFVDCEEVDEMLKPLKVTPRCIPLDQDDSEGICIFTGK